MDRVGLKPKEITIHIEFFGAFRQFGKGLDINIPAGSTVRAVKSALSRRLNDTGLVTESVLANDNTILQDTDIITDDNIRLAVLPPVCGG